MRWVALGGVVVGSLGGCSELVPGGERGEIGAGAVGASDADAGSPLPGELPPGSGTGSGTFGAPCDENQDCDSGLCLQTPDGTQCTDECNDQCPEGWRCLLVNVAGDPTSICVPDHPRLCDPCTTNSDCEGQFAGTDAHCIPDGEHGSFCGGKCTPGDESDCPEGHACVMVVDVAGMDLPQCRPTTGECQCSKSAVYAALATPCSATDSYGTCQGVRQCTPEGLSACSAALAAPELCDGADNDCDGKTDEGFELDLPDGSAVTSVGQPCGKGWCAGGIASCSPTQDGLVCSTLGAASEEVCDGMDNDCNGVIDDGLSLTQPDGSLLEGPGAACGLGACAGGKLVCETGAAKIVCSSAGLASPEECDGVDNDCDGLTDAADPGLAVAPCEQQTGSCAGAQKSPELCVAGQWQPCGPDQYGQGYDGLGESKCDGVDEDCDGSTDEDFTLLGPDGSLASGVGAPCGTGACAGGKTTCNPAHDGLECESAGASSLEVCDAEDNDCNGATDDGLTLLEPDGSLVEGLGSACGLGACASGTLVCEDGGTAVACSSAGLASPEVCDGVDNDCDGLVDAADASLPPPLCELQAGWCEGAVKAQALCVGGGWQPCGAAEYGPGFEPASEAACDGVDEDCDGSTDEDFALLGPEGSLALGVGAPCGAGVCAGGETACNPAQDGLWCDSSGGASAEVCDGLDNDCDALTDAADASLVPVPCEDQDGVCEGSFKPASLCQGAAGFSPCGDPEYAAGAATYEATEAQCDGLDNDCDGETDAGDADLAGVVVPCEEQAGVCAGSTKPPSLCADGSFEPCTDATYLAQAPAYEAPGELSCDGLDNDCDGAADEDFPDLDADGLADCVDPDIDGDTVPNGSDNCPIASNLDQADQDDDGAGDVCDPDDDNDEVADPFDNCPLFANADQLDTDDDGAGDLCDPDDDDDQVADPIDCQPLDPLVFPGQVEACNGVDDNCEAGIDEGFYGTLQGCLCGPAGQARIAGVLVTLESADCLGAPVALQASTDANGCYAFTQVPAGAADVQYQDQGFGAAFVVTVVADGVVDANAQVGAGACFQVPKETCPGSFQCAIRAGGCLGGEFLTGGGCAGALDGCYPGPSSWAASGPAYGVGSSFVVCCTALPGLDPQSQQVRGVASSGSAVSSGCAPGEIALSGGGYSSAGWPVSVSRSATAITTSTPGYNNSLSATAICYKTVNGGPDLLAVSGGGAVACPADRQIIGGSWSGCAIGSSAYPSGNGFVTNCGSATALCAKFTPPTVCGGP